MSKRSIAELMNTPVDFIHDTDDELLSRFNINYQIYKDIPVSRMTPRLIDAVIQGQIFDFADRVPKTKWTKYFIECTVMVEDMRHLLDVALVTEEMIDDMCIFGYDCLKYLPHNKHPYHQAFKAVREGIEWINYINPIFIKDIVGYVESSGDIRLGGFSRIKDALKLSIDEVILELNDRDIVQKGMADEKVKGFIRVWQYRLEALEPNEVIARCVKLNAPEALRHILGAQVAAASFPQAPKRQWITDDLGM
jgi:hypothetical protein